MHGTCDHCKKFCPSLAAHIGHSKLCKIAYGQDNYEKLKKESRILSKRRYRKNLSDDVKKRRYAQEKVRRCANSKKRYVPIGTFTSDKGRMFENMFKRIYDIVIEETNPKILEIVEKEDPDFDVFTTHGSTKTVDSAMDWVFQTGLDKLSKTDPDDLEAVFDEMFIMFKV